MLLLLSMILMLISIHVPREGHDKSLFERFDPSDYISIHVPREGHDVVLTMPAIGQIISIHVPREGHDTALYKVAASTDFISIHVPREGHDDCKVILYDECIPISIHVPREGHDVVGLWQAIKKQIFQSTCPARGTTIHNAAYEFQFLHFNPRAPRGARHRG